MSLGKGVILEQIFTALIWASPLWIFLLCSLYSQIGCRRSPACTVPTNCLLSCYRHTGDVCSYRLGLMVLGCVLCHSLAFACPSMMLQKWNNDCGSNFPSLTFIPSLPPPGNTYGLWLNPHYYTVFWLFNVSRKFLIPCQMGSTHMLMFQNSETVKLMEHGLPLCMLANIKYTTQSLLVLWNWNPT